MWCSVTPGGGRGSGWGKPRRSCVTPEVIIDRFEFMSVMFPSAHDRTPPWDNVGHVTNAERSIQLYHFCSVPYSSAHLCLPSSFIYREPVRATQLYSPVWNWKITRRPPASPVINSFLVVHLNLHTGSCDFVLIHRHRNPSQLWVNDDGLPCFLHSLG